MRVMVCGVRWVVVMVVTWWERDGTKVVVAEVVLGVV